MTLTDSFDAKRNNFDLIRIAAAMLVVFSHSFPMTHQSYEPFALLGGYETGGGLAVNAFIVISGFLIAKSAERGDFNQYFLSRCLRIIPALAAITAIQFLVIGPIFTSESLRHYFGDIRTWTQWGNLLVFPMQTVVPSVFANMGQPHMNGPLWTLPVEFSFYLILPLLIIGRLYSRRAFWIVPPSLLAFHLYQMSQGCGWGNECGQLFMNVPLYSAVKLATFFSFGAAAWLYRSSIPIKPWVAGLAIVFLAISSASPIKEVVHISCYSYLVIFAGTYRYIPAKAYERVGDLSYGTYIIAWPVQQMILSVYGEHLNPYVFTIAAIVPTLLLAAASWHFVEKPALSLKGRLKSRVVVTTTASPPATDLLAIGAPAQLRQGSR